MKKTNFKGLARFCSVLTAAALLAGTFTVAYAEDSVQSLEDKTSDLKNELSGLNAELDTLNAELNSTMEKMQTTSSELEQTKQELANAKAEEAQQYQSMKKRIKYIYENGNTSILEMLFDSGSMVEFLNRADFVSTVSEVDRSCLEELVETQATVVQKEQQLQQQKEELSVLQANLNNQEADLQSKISSTSGSLEQYTAQLAEARRRAEEALQKEAEAKLPPKNPPAVPPSGGSNPPVNPSASEMEIFAALIECEAGSRDYEGMLAVASVVMNRVHSRLYPNTITGVIYQSGQFSPTFPNTGGNGISKLDKVLRAGVKGSCMQAARDAVSGKNNVPGCYSFRAASTGHSGIIIGGNVFF